MSRDKIKKKMTMGERGQREREKKLWGPSRHILRCMVAEAEWNDTRRNVSTDYIENKHTTKAFYICKARERTCWTTMEEWETEAQSGRERKREKNEKRGGG